MSNYKEHFQLINPNKRNEVLANLYTTHEKAMEQAVVLFPELEDVVLVDVELNLEIWRRK